VKPGRSPYAGFRDRPIFIGACPRSGTTLLRAMLNRHPEISLPRETRFIRTVWYSRAQWQDLRSREARARLAAQIGVVRTTHANRFGTPKSELLRRLTDAPPTLGSVVGTCFKLYAESTGKPRWGDKRPMYSRYLDLVFTLFPDAQVINVTRDPRAAIASIRKLDWYGGQVVPSLELWMRSVHSVDPWRTRLFGDQLIDVRYEDLVVDPATVLRNLTDFLVASPDAISAMLDYHDHVDEVATHYHGRLNEPVNPTRIDAWTRVLEPGEVAMIERVAGKLMDRFGYEQRESDTAQPAELRRAYRSYRRRAEYARRKREVVELKRSLEVKRPLGAKLTSGQLAVSDPPSMPPFWQRHIGKI
jgi:hypothetical protein